MAPSIFCGDTHTAVVVYHAAAEDHALLESVHKIIAVVIRRQALPSIAQDGTNDDSQSPITHLSKKFRLQGLAYVCTVLSLSPAAVLYE